MVGEDGFGAFAPNGSKLRSCGHQAGRKQGSTGTLHLIVRIREHSLILQKTAILTDSGFMVGEDGFEYICFR